MEEIPSKKQKNPGLARATFGTSIMKLHAKLNEIQNDIATSPEFREQEIARTVSDFYDFLEMDAMLEAYELKRETEVKTEV